MGVIMICQTTSAHLHNMNNSEANSAKWSVRMGIIFAQSLWTGRSPVSVSETVTFKQDFVLKAGKTYKGGLLITDLSLQDLAYYDVVWKTRNEVLMWLTHLPVDPCSNAGLKLLTEKEGSCFQ